VAWYIGESHDFLVGGWCHKCRKMYPLAEADVLAELGADLGMLA